MAKKDVIEIQGEVVEILPNSMYRIAANLSTAEGKQHLILGHASGKIQRHNIMIMRGDQVLVELSPYDLERGRITRRLNSQG